MNYLIEPAPDPPQQSNLNIYLLFILLLLNQLDAAFTLFFIFEKGVEEMNPFVNWIIQNYGPDGFLLTKGIMVLIPAIFLFIYRDRGVSKVLIPFVTVVYSLIVLYHIFFLFQLA